MIANARTGTSHGFIFIKMIENLICNEILNEFYENQSQDENKMDRLGIPIERSPNDKSIKNYGKRLSSL